MNNINLVPELAIIQKIHLIRDQKIMLDSDLALLYNVETKYLKRQVRRNIDRFPKDFMFELTHEEFNDLRCQFGTSSWGGSRYIPMAFTEQGVAQLSSVLNSDRAIKVNIQIIRLFTRMRKLLMMHQEMAMKFDKMENEIKSHGKDIQILFEYLKRLLQNENSKVAKLKRNRIGFK